jgi:hypothetical protein
MSRGGDAAMGERVVALIVRIPVALTTHTMTAMHDRTILFM